MSAQGKLESTLHLTAIVRAIEGIYNTVVSVKMAKVKGWKMEREWIR